MLNNMSKNSISLFKDKKVIIFLCVLGLIGVVFILFGNKNAKSNKEAGYEELDPKKYAQQIEEQVEQLCNRVDGVSSAYAVVTLKGGYRAIYATDSQNGSSSYKTETVIIGSGSSKQGLLIGYENPEIAGIGIVCSGGDNYNVRKNLVSIVSSAFNISTNKIFVSGS